MQNNNIPISNSRLNTPAKENEDIYNKMRDMNYYSLSRTAEDNVTDQIVRLRSDINKQYVEMSNLFGKLKMDVAEANQLKSEAERELTYIKDELIKRKMENMVYENKLNLALEKNAPYNNLHIPMREVDPLYYNHTNLDTLRPDSNNLQSTSDMIYATDMINENNSNRVRQLSALAKVGQSLVGESEFVPIQNNSNNLSNNLDNNFSGFNNQMGGYDNQMGRISPVDNSDNYDGNNQMYNLDAHSQGQMINLDDNNLNPIQSQKMNMGQGGQDYGEMYSKLDEIADLNNQVGKEKGAN